MTDRVRAALSLALVWGALWGLVGFGYGLWGWLRFVGPDAHLLDLVGGGAAYAGPFAVQGFLWGGVFAVLLGRGGQGRSFDELTLPRVTTIGIVGGAIAGVLGAIASGALVGAGSVPVEGRAILGAMLGAVTASTTLAVARQVKLESAAGLHEIPVSGRAHRVIAGD